ncbi:MAG: phosphoadenylyl-sulfate reductase, partial [Lapillicoccus sp.]
PRRRGGPAMTTTPVASRTDLVELAEDADRRLCDAPAEEVIAWATVTFGSRLAAAVSMQDGVLAHLVSRVAPDTDVLFLDTGYHFVETLGTRRAIASSYQLNVVDVTPRQTVAEQDAQCGRRLYERDPDLCCQLRKQAPLDEALESYDAWVNGVRRDETASRTATRVVGYDDRRGIVSISPLASWTDDSVTSYIRHHDVIVNPLLLQGFPSIGCEPCTRRVADGADPRSGRWAGRAKTECGIHR